MDEANEKAHHRDQERDRPRPDSNVNTSVRANAPAKTSVWNFKDVIKEFCLVVKKEKSMGNGNFPTTLYKAVAFLTKEQNGNLATFGQDEKSGLTTGVNPDDILRSLGEKFA